MGGEYVLFLWKGPSGLTHIVGLSQGLFKVSRDANGQVIATREASAGPMLDPATGHAVGDQSASYTSATCASAWAPRLPWEAPSESALRVIQRSVLLALALTGWWAPLPHTPSSCTTRPLAARTLRFQRGTISRR